MFAKFVHVTTFVKDVDLSSENGTRGIQTRVIPKLYL